MTDLVIDASVARAAGTSNAPESTRCREFFEAIRTTNSLKCVFTPELREEWGRHASRYSTTWRAAMYSRRRVRALPSAQDDGLRRNLARCARAIAANDQARIPGIQSAMEKDAHLLEAALKTEGAVASLDDKVRRHFSVCARDNHSLRIIPWINPTSPEEGAVAWVLAGSPAEQSRTLGHAATPE
ncbi:hypothetical protein [Thiococcus pfennigii]|uniref:hypothetical protein n=1 Tax=Thiococcus pfennigii TaxID=1057 RepID=UPI001903D11C|nr:hypothetical protein [Thiococcus pfennigii]MBK1700139.1 hypothetical protein [Thiococcus pfennigii]